MAKVMYYDIVMSSITINYLLLNMRKYVFWQKRRGGGTPSSLLLCLSL